MVASRKSLVKIPINVKQYNAVTKTMNLIVLMKKKAVPDGYAIVTVSSSVYQLKVFGFVVIMQKCIVKRMVNDWLQRCCFSLNNTICVFFIQNSSFCDILV